MGMIALTFYRWRCAIVAELTFQPSEGALAPHVSFTGYRNSHLRLNGFDDIDYLASFYVLGRDVLRPGDTGSVQIGVAISAESAERINAALQEGNGFSLLGAGRPIATGWIRAVLTPPGPWPD
jgi:hypothetical protein